MTGSRAERPISILVRFGVAAALLGYVANAYQSPLVSRAIPLFRIWFDTFDDTFTTVDLGIVRLNGEDVIQRTATPTHIHVVGAKVVWTGEEVRLQTNGGAGLVLQPFVLGFALALAWPWKRWLELGLRFVMACPLLLAVVLLDLPTIIYGMQWYAEVQLLDPDHRSPLIQWADMMNSGGRFVLTAVAAAIATFGAARLVPGRAMAATADDCHGKPAAASQAR